jgi:hypothetical protein
MPYIGKKPADIIATAVDTTTGTFSGDIDVDGTTNLDVVDIDGAVNMATTALVTGVLTANGGAVFNEAGADVDFRVESDTVTHALFVQGSDGNVGIGTATPSAPLTVKAPSDAEAIHVVGRSDDIGQIIFYEADGTTKTAKIDARATVFNVGAIANIPMAFATNNTERMRIDSSGNLLVGKTVVTSTQSGIALAPASGSGYMTLAHENGASSGRSYAVFTYNAGVIGNIAQNGTTGILYNTSSDYRLKENVVTEWDATTRLKQLKPSRFNFIAEADRTVDGFLAHEVQEIVPEAITGTKDAVDADGKPIMQGIDQSKLVPLLVKTIQELEARITALEGA